MYEPAEYAAGNTAGTGAGDIRHCFADGLTRARGSGFEAEIPLERGLAELVEWLAGQAATDRFDEASAELTERGLAR